MDYMKKKKHCLVNIFTFKKDFMIPTYIFVNWVWSPSYGCWTRAITSTMANKWNMSGKLITSPTWVNMSLIWLFNTGILGAISFAKVLKQNNFINIWLCVIKEPTFSNAKFKMLYQYSSSDSLALAIKTNVLMNFHSYNRLLMISGI